MCAMLHSASKSIVAHIHSAHIRNIGRALYIASACITVDLPCCIFITGARASAPVHAAQPELQAWPDGPHVDNSRLSLLVVGRAWFDTAVLSAL
jgi:hypothetical protein